MIFKEIKFYESKHAVSECRCLKNMRLVILFDMFLNPNFKITTRFANVARTTASIAAKVTYSKRFQIIRD